MESAFGVDHGVSKMYQETRVANAQDLQSGVWATRKYKQPGKLKRTLMPKRAKEQSKKASQPFYATRYDELMPGDPSLLSHGKLGQAKEVKRFSRYVQGEHDPKGKRSY